MTKEEYLAAVEALQQLYVHANTQITEIEGGKHGKQNYFLGFDLDQSGHIILEFYDPRNLTPFSHELSVPKD